MKSEYFFIVQAVGNPVSSDHLKTIQEAYSLIAGMQGEFLIEKFDSLSGLVEQYRVSVAKMKRES